MTRLITAIGLLAFALFLIFIAPRPLFISGALTMSLLCYREFGGLVVGHRIPHPGIWGLLAGVFILFWPELFGTTVGFLPGLVLIAILALIGALRSSDLNGILQRVSCAVFGALYTFAPWRFSIDLRDESVHLLAFALALNWVGDSAAYYVGRRFGKHRLAPVVSPKKSWEGAAASVAASLLFGLVYLGHFLPAFPKWEIALMAVIGNIAGQFGDLAESAIKRGAGVKDSGDLLPGHGGVLDRVDSSLFALPVVLFVNVSITHKLY
ncbi:MAG: phosphatidate cytidylyltransferase [Acidobacteriota bacterium]|nr:phosphatidate cytidylyltransferase [Acidobacteriota bacterium]MDQ2840931.1 phosphatidate cytidylyltransferase [Acidobacteriota bacterium]